MNSEFFALLALPLKSLILFLLTHILFWNFAPRKWIGLKSLILLAVGSPLLFILLGRDEVSVLGASFYSLAMVAYFHLYVGMERSVSIRILDEIHQCPNHESSMKQILDAYSPEEMFSRRLEWLVHGGWLSVSASRSYQALPKARVLARVLIFFHRFYSLERTG